MSKREDAVAEMAALHERASTEGRTFTEDEEASWTYLKAQAEEAKGETMEEQVIERPAGHLRPVAGAVRSLTDAFVADGAAARYHSHRTARVDVPVNVRAIGSDQATSPAPGLVVPPAQLGLIPGYFGLYGRLLDALAISYRLKAATQSTTRG